MFQCVDQCFAQGYGRVLAGFVDAIALENGGLDNERALVGQQGGKRRFGGAGEGVVGAGVGDGDPDGVGVGAIGGEGAGAGVGLGLGEEAVVTLIANFWPKPQWPPNVQM